MLLAGLGFGLLAGAGEAVAAAIRQQAMHRTLFMSRDYFWQLPLAEAATFLVLALLLATLGRLWRRLRRPAVVLGALSALTVLALVLLSERIHPAAAAVLSLGLGVAIARLLAPRAEPLRRALRIGALGGLLLCLGAGLIATLVRSVAERRRLAALPAARAGAPNILLLVLDTVRAWSTGLYGYGRPTTPNLQSWAARGALFERTLAPAPWTTVSHAVMFTGRYATELSVAWNRALDGAHPTLAEVLRSAGYATGGFVANFTQAGSPTGLARGFAHYEDYPLRPIALLRRTTLLRKILADDRVARLLGRRRVLEGRFAEEVNARFLRWVDRRSGRPWFAFLNYFDAHGPYLPPEPFETMYTGKRDPVTQRYWSQLLRAYGPPPIPVPELAVSLDAYDGGITYLDREIDVLLRQLAGRGQLANTIIVITSDHGELFGEHGVISHGNSLFLPVLHVPLVLVAPGRVPANTRIPSLASLRDLPATLLELAGVANPGLPGHSLVARWTPGAVGGGADTLYATVGFNRLLPRWPPSPVLKGTMHSIVLDSLQLIENGDGKEELYHLGEDSWQVRNLVAVPAYQSELNRYRAALRQLLKQTSATARR